MASSQKPSLRQTLKHFSHQHALRPFEPKDEDEIICSGCELDILTSSSSAYKCTKSNCDYFLHKSCLSLPPELQQQFHPQHSLTLLSSSAYIGGKFICNACDDYGTAFHYHCSPCNYDLHIACSKMPQTLVREDHVHPLTLFSSSTCDRALEKFICDICNRIVRKSRWVYYCPDCDFGVDICCANATKDDSSATASSHKFNNLSDCFLYKSCLKLPQELQHKSHPDHPLRLLSPTVDTRFTCNACDEYGTGFRYRCSTCDYDLHIACSNMKLPDTLKLEDHLHPLTLSDSSKFDTVTCDICNRVVPKRRWVYYCSSPFCDYGIEMRCITAIAVAEECPANEESREKLLCTQESMKYSLSQLQNQLRRLQVQNETNFQTATKMIIDMRRNLTNSIS